MIPLNNIGNNKMLAKTQLTSIPPTYTLTKLHIDMSAVFCITNLLFAIFMNKNVPYIKDVIKYTMHALINMLFIIQNYV
jgi:hypothetical protein